MSSKESTTFCAVPWTQVATNASGYYRICCNALPVKNLVRNQAGQVLSIYKNPVDEAWESPTYQEIRRQMLNSERPEMCLRCFREEDAGVESARQKWNHRWKKEIQAQQASVLSPRYIDLRLGNLCNLKCRMCNPYASSKWVDEWNSVVSMAQLVPGEALSEEEVKRLKSLDWPEDPRTWENLQPLLESVEEIYLTGGEPFLSLKQTELLQCLIQSKRSRQVTLKYNTNLTVLPEKIFSLWKEFKLVRLNVSLDGVAELNQYIRFPSNWEVVTQNLDQLFDLKKQGYPLEINIHTTVQNYNILDLHRILEFIHQKYQIIPYLNILNHPAALNIRALPPALKELAVTSLSAWSGEKGISEVISYMLAENWSTDYWVQFVRYTKQLDALRNEEFLSLQPQMRESFGIEP